MYWVHEIMPIWAILPVKHLRISKSRLAEVLSQDEREGLCRDLLIRTLRVLSSSPTIERTLVISRDATVIQLARAHGAHTVNECGSSDLNLALQKATEVAASLGATSVLIIATDLPRLQSDDISILTQANGSSELVVVAPDRCGQGTNALFVRPPGLLQYNFGAGSMRAHTEQARGLGLEVRICRLPGTQFDVDVPRDLEHMRAEERQLQAREGGVDS